MYLSLRSLVPSPLREVAGRLGFSKPLLDLMINELDKGIVLKIRAVIYREDRIFLKHVIEIFKIFQLAFV